MTPGQSRPASAKRPRSTRAATPGAGATAVAGAAGRAAAVALGSRLALIAVALLTVVTLGVRQRAAELRDPRAEALDGFAAQLFEPWAHWDGVWFVRIAADGYAAHAHSQAFFPLYPLLMRLVHRLTGLDLVIAGVVLSLLAYAGAMVLLYQLTKAEVGARAALWSVVFISLAPTTLFFQAVYSESLFLFLALACFTAARRGSWLLAGLAGLLATLTRSAGIVLLLPLALMWWEQYRGQTVKLPGGAAAVKPPARRPRPASFAALALVPAGLGIYMAYLWWRFGDPFVFGSAQSQWGRAMTAPWTAIVEGVREAFTGIEWLAVVGLPTLFGMRNETGGVPIQQLANVLEFIGLVIAVLLFIAAWRRLPAAYVAYAAAALLLPLLYPIQGRALSSLPRFVVVDFPLFMAAGAALAQRRLARWLVLALFVALLAGATVYFISWA